MNYKFMENKSLYFDSDFVFLVERFWVSYVYFIGEKSEFRGW